MASVVESQTQLLDPCVGLGSRQQETPRGLLLLFVREPVVPRTDTTRNGDDWGNCDQCNYATHRCHFCGDDIPHNAKGLCYECWKAERAGEFD